MTSSSNYRMTLKNIENSALTYYYIDRTIIIAYPNRLPKMSSVSIDYIYYPNTQLSMDIINNKNTILGIVGFIFKNGTDFRWNLIVKKHLYFMDLIHKLRGWPLPSIYLLTACVMDSILTSTSLTIDAKVSAQSTPM